MIFDVIVIGAGINGSASAYELRNNQHKNTLLLEQVSKDTLLSPFSILSIQKCMKITYVCWLTDTKLEA